MPSGNTDIIDSDALKAFCQAIAKADESDAILRQKESPSFNVFRALRGEEKELLHSNWLAYLFDPVKEHGQGTLFLEAFLSECELPNGEGSILKKIAPQLTLRGTRWLVSPEVSFNDGDLTGRIDLVLRCSALRCVIAIENKRLAADQHNQVKRYSDNWLEKQSEHKERKFLLYLTPDGHAPKTLDGRALAETGMFKPLNVSYEDHLKRALKHCLDFCQNNPKLLPVLQQYYDMITEKTQSDSPGVIDVLTDTKHASCLLAFYKNERAAFGEARKKLVNQFKDVIQNLYPGLIPESSSVKYDDEYEPFTFTLVNPNNRDFQVTAGDYIGESKKGPIGWAGRYGLFIAFGTRTPTSANLDLDSESDAKTLKAKLLEAHFNFLNQSYFCARHLPETTDQRSDVTFADYYFNGAQTTDPKAGWLYQAAQEIHKYLDASGEPSLVDQVCSWAEAAKAKWQSKESPPQ